ncbi:uncharacterized protein [Anoplolepis gracilipes]|uniref:uncharacterized protein n=1 Tax=Anoplolepis gracilipes TaxID=354296 RepID=UPI003B9EB17C
MEIILARDQRTTTHRVLDRAPQSYALNSISTLSPKCQNVVASNYYTEATITRTMRNNCAQRRVPCNSHLMSAFYDRRIRLIRPAPVRVSTWTGLRLSWLWLSVIAILLTSSVHSNPIMDNSSGEVNIGDSSDNIKIEEDIRNRLTTTPKWMDPCGPIYVYSDVLDSQDVVEMPSNEQLTHSISIQAENAIHHAIEFRDRYMNEIFKKKYNSSNILFGDIHYDWLPDWNEIPKRLGDKLDPEYCDKLDLDTALLNSYEYMQKYAMCLEQIVWDQELLGLDFYSEFLDCEFKCRNLLCELQGAMMERGITPRSNVNRSVMPLMYRGKEMRHNATFRNLRDWLCFRDYMNGLEYVHQVFAHLHKRFSEKVNAST